jgi:hypothetical protein
MWSHYADNHIAVCLQFKVMDILDDIHPCFYAEKMPNVDWQSDNINLTLIKADPWNYEAEWRYVKKTIRPKMMVLARATHNIYSQVHSLDYFTQNDKEEWSEIQTKIMDDIQNSYLEQCKLIIKPSKIFVGLNFSRNYENMYKHETVKRIDEIAKQHNILINRIHAQPDSFKLNDSPINDLDMQTFPLMA